MPLDSNASALHDLETLLADGPLGPCTDGQLLERFGAGPPGHSAEAAFATLVDRHSAMVLRVCRSVGLDPSDADDAAQATFLLLARRSRSLWVQSTLAPWLHAVALRTARQARRGAVRRARHERQAALARPAADPDVPSSDPDLERLLHAEIDRLPDRFRRALILCDLEGCPHDEAARRLGCATGTVKSRLSRARSRLRTRLLARGLAPASVAALAAVRSVRASVLAGPPHRTALELARAAARPWPPHLIPLLQGVSRMLVLRSLVPRATATLAIASTLGLAAATARGPGQDPAPAPAAKQAPAPMPSPLPPMVADFQPDRVVERGRFAPARVETLPSTLDREATVVSLVRPGTMVKKGDVVARLDSGVPDDALDAARLATRRAQSAVEEAERNVAIAEIALTEFLEGTFPIEEQALEAQVKLAQITLAGIDAAGAPQPGAADDHARLEARIAQQKAEFALHQAQTHLSVLREYTRAKQTRTFQAQVEAARNRLAEARESLAIEQARLKRLIEKIEKSEIHAPIDGMVDYPQREFYPPETPVLGTPEFHVDRGVRIRPGQALVEVRDELGPLVVETTIKEVYVDRLRPGQDVTITCGEGDKQQTLAGFVDQVSPEPTHDAYSRDVPGTKRYAVRIRLRDELRDMRSPIAWTPPIQVEIATPRPAP
jgi:RNA polymerase sigma factor (sigma-70 family)